MTPGPSARMNSPCPQRDSSCFVLVPCSTECALWRHRAAVAGAQLGLLHGAAVRQRALLLARAGALEHAAGVLQVRCGRSVEGGRQAVRQTLLFMPRPGC